MGHQGFIVSSSLKRQRLIYPWARQGDSRRKEKKGKQELERYGAVAGVPKALDLSLSLSLPACRRGETRRLRLGAPAESIVRWACHDRDPRGPSSGERK